MLVEPGNLGDHIPYSSAIYYWWWSKGALDTVPKTACGGIDYSHAKTNGLRQVTSYDMLVAGIVVIDSKCLWTLHHTISQSIETHRQKGCGLPGDQGWMRFSWLSSLTEGMTEGF